MDLDVGAQRAAELLNCLTVVTFTSNKYHDSHGTRAILTLFEVMYSLYLFSLCIIS
jgi:hypothetical protein